MAKSEDEKKVEAHNKGQEDFKKCGGQANPMPIIEFAHPTYKPPSGYEKEYKEGWDNAKKQNE